MKPLRLGLFGFGCVGQGLHEVLERSSNLDLQIRKICIKDIEKERSLDPAWFTDRSEDLLEDSGIDVIVELIDDSEAAFEIVKDAMRRSKPVVSANKKMIAEHLPELLELQEKHQVPLLYEAACCASIPIIRNLEEYYDNDMLSSVSGIFNGSTNYILTQMIEADRPYEYVLKEAQEKGFAETDPSLDVLGVDPKYKLCIVLLHSFGLLVNPDEVFNFGITRINDFDLNYARQNGYTIKLLTKGSKKQNQISAYCIPSLVPFDSVLSSTRNEYNAVELESSFSEKQLLIGKGAGDTATGAAVLSDISALTYNYKYAYKKLFWGKQQLSFTNDISIEVYLRYADEMPDLPEGANVIEEYRGPEFSYTRCTLQLGELIDLKLEDREDVSLLLIP